MIYSIKFFRSIIFYSYFNMILLRYKYLRIFFIIFWGFFGQEFFPYRCRIIKKIVKKKFYKFDDPSKFFLKFRLHKKFNYYSKVDFVVSLIIFFYIENTPRKLNIRVPTPASGFGNLKLWYTVSCNKFLKEP